MDPGYHTLSHNSKLNEQAIISVTKQFENPKKLSEETLKKQEQEFQVPPTVRNQ